MQSPQPSRRRSMRRRSSSPLLPVIHEDDHDSPLTASPASGTLIGAAAARAGHNSASSSSSSSGVYNQLQQNEHQIVWPPEDDTSWPPSNRADRDFVHSNYGSVQEYSIEYEGYITSSPSSSEDESPASLERNQRASRHYRRLRLLLTAVFAISLSAVVWMPLLQQRQQSSDRDEEHLSNVDDDAYLDPWSEEAYDTSAYPPAFYRHRHFYGGEGESQSGGFENGTADRESHETFATPVLSASMSFADLAAALIPPYFQMTVDLCASTIVPARANGTDISTTSVMPGDVYLLRKTMLKTRDLFDVFSPVYAKHSSLDDYWGSAGGRHVSWGSIQRFQLMMESDDAGRHSKASKKREMLESTRTHGEKDTEFDDLWKVLRHHLAMGYRLIGEYQDLDHAHIKYNSDQLADYQLQVWQWYDDFQSFVEENRQHISLYLSLPCKKKHPTSSRNVRCRHDHSHSSHLFWGNITSLELPDGNRDGATTVLGRLGISQLKRAGLYLEEALTYEHVLIGLDDADTTAAVSSGVHEVYHNLRKELRSFLDEVVLFGELLLVGTALVPEIEKGADGGARNATVDEAIKGRIEEALAKLRRARKLLGDLNDDFVAHSAYVEWNEYPEERARLRVTVEARWGYFGTWAAEAELASEMQFLIEVLDASPLNFQSLDAFLIERRANPSSHLVIGNDAGDADSIISAIALAYIESHNGDEMMPIVSIPKDIFERERPEVNLLLQLAGIDDPSNKLLFLDDLKAIRANDASAGLPSRALSLVDHNTLNESLERYHKKLLVTEIVDHHEDRGQYMETCSGNRRTVAFDDGRALVASTATLVAERLRTCCQEKPYSASLGMILIGTILLDSVNLDESIGKVTQRDMEAVDDLLSNTEWGAAPVDTDDLFNKLQRAKYDSHFWESLPVGRALAYDYKEFRSRGKRSSPFGVSTILMPGLDFMSKDNFCKATATFMESHHVAFLGVMFAFYDAEGAFHRQLAFVTTRRGASLDKFAEKLEYDSVDLQLEEVKLAPDFDCKRHVLLFEQKNLAPSRKQIGPLLEAIL
ncbi:hypothetical protein ACHAXT_012684 [Thalassiosira profunda]